MHLDAHSLAKRNRLMSER